MKIEEKYCTISIALQHNQLFINWCNVLAKMPHVMVAAVC